MKKIVPIVLLLCLLLGLMTACGKAETSADPEPSAALAASEPQALSLRFAESYDEVFAAVGDARKAIDAQNSARAEIDYETSTYAMDDAAMEAQGEGMGDGGTYYSLTNTQVAGVDEGDIVKTDGTYFYILRDYELIIMQADGRDVTEVSHTILGAQWDTAEQSDGVYIETQKTPLTLYLVGDRAVVLSEDYRGVETEESWSSDSHLTVDILDLTDRSAPQVIKTLGQDGYYVDSRMIDDKLFLCTAYYVDDPDAKDPDTFVPCLYTDGERTPVDCGTIGFLPGGGSLTYSVISSYDIAAAGLVTTQSVLGGGYTVYMNPDNLYVASIDYQDNVTEEGEDGPYAVTTHLSAANTTIHRFAVSDGKLTYGATGSVPGNLNNQFSMDEKVGNLRVVTTEDADVYKVYVDEAHKFQNYESVSSDRSNSVYVLGQDLLPIGSATGIAPDETVYSVRFDGDWGYLCTYRTTDPIFAVDLSDPTAPAVVGALKLTGYSDYLHLWTEDLLFGLGMQTQEITDDDGDVTARLDGMKLVMIDTSDPANLTECSTLEIDADYSEALSNHKAILIDHDRNLIAFPAEGSYLIYGYSDEKGFELTKEVSVGEWDWNNRGVYIGDYFYVVGNDQIQVIDLNTLENVNQAILSRG